MTEIQKVVFEDEVTLYWERESPGRESCEIYLDGEFHGTAASTHYTISGLAPGAAHEITVKGADARTIQVVTPARRKRMDVTAAPYFAVGDGIAMNTERIQRALDDCGPGETVYFPAGIYKTGALRLHSDMELYLEEGAVIQGTDVPEDYLPRIWSRFEGTEMYCYSSLLNLGTLNHEEGYNCRNVAIRGKGVIASGGRALAERVIALERENLKEYLESQGDAIWEYEKPDTLPGRVRPRLVNISNCQNIVMAGVTFRDGASWNVHMIYSDQILTYGCSFYSKGVWNGDGWDPDSSTNCTIFGCDFFTGDDSVAVKSGKNPEGNKVNRPTEHIRVFDCKCAFGHGICIGSEMSGGVSDIRIWDCDLRNSMSGIEIKATRKRGGYVRDVHVQDCAVARVMFHSVSYNDDGVGAEEPPVFENCSFENMRIFAEYLDHEDQWHACDAIELCGFDAPGHELRDIRFGGIQIGSAEKPRRHHISMQLCRGVTLQDIQCF